MFEWGAVLKRNCVFFVVQILTREQGYVNDNLCVRGILYNVRKTPKCVDIISQNLLVISAWNLASALNTVYVWTGLSQFKIWLDLPTQSQEYDDNRFYVARSILRSRADSLRFGACDSKRVTVAFYCTALSGSYKVGCRLVAFCVHHTTMHHITSLHAKPHT